MDFSGRTSSVIPDLTRGIFLTSTRWVSGNTKLDLPWEISAPNYDSFQADWILFSSPAHAECRPGPVSLATSADARISHVECLCILFSQELIYHWQTNPLMRRNAHNQFGNPLRNMHQFACIHIAIYERRCFFDVDTNIAIYNSKMYLHSMPTRERLR